MLDDRARPLLRTERLTRRFGGLVAVSDLDFEIRPGEILGLIGPNGAGKSTTFNLISGFNKPSAGKLFILGEDCTGKSARAISRMGLVRTFQHGSVMAGMSVRDNIRVGLLHDMRRRTRKERTARIEETAALLGIEAHLDSEAGALPHGLQRLVSMAVALAARPRLLCLDEPLTGLNQTEVQHTIEVLKQVRDRFGTTMLLVEHNMKAVMSICDRIVVLHHGQYLASGTPEEIRANQAVIDCYLGGVKHER